MFGQPTTREERIQQTERWLGATQSPWAQGFNFNAQIKPDDPDERSVANYVAQIRSLLRHHTSVVVDFSGCSPTVEQRVLAELTPEERHRTRIHCTAPVSLQPPANVGCQAASMLGAVSSARTNDSPE